MTGRIEWLHAGNGTVIAEPATVAPSLQDMQDYVNGYIEVVHVMVDDKACQMIVNEEGLRMKLPVNVVASKHYATFALKEHGMFPPAPIFGNAILLVGLVLD